MYKPTFFLTAIAFVAAVSLNTLLAQGCNCTDYLYVNDPTLDITHKFALNPDGSVGNEIFSSGTTPWLAPGVIENAHGVVSDIAGNLYISQIDTDPTVLYQIGCDGTVKSSDYIPNWDRTLNLATIGTTLYSIGRDPNGGAYMIYSHDLCSQSDIASIALPDLPSGGNFGWGLTVGFDGELYFTQKFAGTTDDHCVHRVDADLTTTTEIFCIPNVPGHQTLGVAQDECGNFYVVVTDSTPGSTTIFKVDANGNIIHSITDANLNGDGFGGGWGIVYNEVSGRLYVGTLGDDCVAVIDAGGCNGDLVYEGASSVPHVPGAYSKAVNIQRECCPNVANVVIDTFICNFPQGDMVFLASLIECADGIMCDAEWQEAGTSSALQFDVCMESATAIMPEGCGTYTLTTPTNGVCTPGTTTVNVGFGSIDAGTLGADMTICEGDNPPTLPIVSNATGTSTIFYQWQESQVSCDSGFTDIAGATSQDYNPPALSSTTYYRLVASIDGCNGIEGCSNISNCLTITVFENPVLSTSGVDVTCNGASDGSATVTASGGTPGYTYAWDDPAAQTTMTATNLDAGTYTVVVTDTNGCTAEDAYTISQPAATPCATISITRN